MKKLGKLNINPEKVMKNEELTTLKGGDAAGSFDCKVVYEGQNFFWDIWIGNDLMTVQGECAVFYACPCYCYEW